MRSTLSITKVPLTKGCNILEVKKKTTSTIFSNRPATHNYRLKTLQMWRKYHHGGKGITYMYLFYNPFKFHKHYF